MHFLLHFFSHLQAKLETKALKAKRPGFTDERYNETSYYYDINSSKWKILGNFWANFRPIFGQFWANFWTNFWVNYWAGFLANCGYFLKNSHDELGRENNERNCSIFSFWEILKTSIFVSYVGGICSWFSQSESVIDIHHNQNLVRSGGKVVFLLSWKWVLRCFTPESKFAILLQSKSYEKFMNGIIHTSPSSFKSLDILLFRKNEIGAHPLFS